LLGKYHFSANAHRSRFASGPKIAKANSASSNPVTSALGQRNGVAVVIG
jgi:hypothetical protein